MSDVPRDRYLIIGAGRSGSSLLASILAGAGAEFDLQDGRSWDRRSGAWEHPGLHLAQRWRSRAAKLEASMVPDSLGRDFCKRRMTRALNQVMTRARFAKSSTLIWLVQPTHKLGFQPSIIISYRRFPDYARSRYLKFGWSMRRIEQTYLEVYSTALLQLHLFGGCAVSYEEIVDPAETAWAEAVARVTGLPSGRLLGERGQMVSSVTSERTFEAGSAMVDELYSSLTELRGRAVKPGGRRYDG